MRWSTVLCAVFQHGPGIKCGISPWPPAPDIACPGRAARPVAVAPDLLIGVPSARDRHVTTVDLPAGAVLFCYTDGLVERRNRAIDDGIEQAGAQPCSPGIRKPDVLA